MDAHDRDIYVVQELMVVFDSHARIEEDHDFFLQILLNESVENKESLVSWTHQICCKKSFHKYSHLAHHESI